MAPPARRASWLLAIATLCSAQIAHAENVVIPAGVDGLMTVELSSTAADFVNAFGYVIRTGSNPPVYNELANTSTTRIGLRVWQLPVNGGDEIEFYLQANTAGLDDFTEAFYSSDPTYNATVDPGSPEKIQQPQQTAEQEAANLWVLRWEDKNTADPGYDGDFNDVVITVRVDGDRDGDGIWDDWEENGIDADYDGVIDLALNLPPYDADPDQKDVFLEVDWMVADDHDHALVLDPGCDPSTNPNSSECAASVVPVLQQAFANATGAPVRLHVDTGPGTPFDLSDGRDHTGGDHIPEIAEIMRPHDSPMVGPNNDFDDLKAAYFDPDGVRRFVFHYLVLGHDMLSCASKSGGVCQTAKPPACGTGNAELPGNDLMVTINTGCNVRNVGQELMRKQTGSVMHELGHNLGLGHGGRVGGVYLKEFYKPNYLSVMNYLYQLTGLGTDVDAKGNYAGGRYDYSRAALATIDENALVEADGIMDGLWDPSLLMRYHCAGDSATLFTMSPAADPIDWDCGGSIDPDPVAAEISNDGDFTELVSSDDWKVLLFSFQGSPYFADGERDRSEPAVEELADDPSIELAPLPTIEVCDGFDNDGDGLVDEALDADGDGIADCVDDCASQPSGTAPTLVAPPDIVELACALPFEALDLQSSALTNACFAPEGRIIEVDGVPADIALVAGAEVPAGVSTVQWMVHDAGGSSASAESTITLTGADLHAELNQVDVVELPSESTFVIPDQVDATNNPLWLPLKAKLAFDGPAGSFDCLYHTVPWSGGTYARDRLNFQFCTNGAEPGELADAESIELRGSLAFGILPFVKPEFFVHLGCQ